MSADSMEKLALLMVELMQEIRAHAAEIAMLRREVLEVKDFARGCACFQQDDFK